MLTRRPVSDQQFAMLDSVAVMPPLQLFTCKFVLPQVRPVEDVGLRVHAVLAKAECA